MKKKIIPIFLIAILLINIMPVNKTYAWSGPVIRVVAGSTAEKVLIGMSEKAGMKYTTKSAREKALRKWNMDLDELIRNHGNIETRRTYQEFVDEMNALDKKVVPLPNNPNYGQVVVDTAMFLIGVDILFDSYHDYKQAVLKEEYVEGLTQSIEDGNSYKVIGDYHTIVESYPGDDNIQQIRLYKGDVRGAPLQYGYGFVIGSAYTFYMTVTGTGTNVKTGEKYRMIEGRYLGPFADGRPADTLYEQTTKWNIPMTEVDVYPSIETWVPKFDELPDLSPIAPSIKPLTDPGISPDAPGVPETLPDKVDIVVPIGDPNPIVPINDPIQDGEKEPDPGTNPNPGPGTNPNPDTGPDTGPNLTPKPGQDVVPQPGPMPEPSPEPLPGEGTPEEGTPTKKPGDTQNRWGKLVTNKFPFSLPWDIAGMIGALMADPKRPSIEVDLHPNFLGKTVNIEFKHDFKWMDNWIGFTRIFILIGFSIFLITSTRRLLGGGQ